jgi:AcrR family transcriptional regulator
MPDIGGVSTIDERDGRTRILQAAAEVFATHGYHHASIRLVAHTAGVTNPAIYYHFQNKEGLYEAVVKEAFDLFKATLEASLEGVVGLRPSLINLATSCISLVRENQVLGRLVFLSLFQSPTTGQPTASRDYFVTQSMAILSALFKEHLPDASDAMIKMSALAFLSLIAGAIEALLIGVTDIDFSPAAMEGVVDFCLRGMGYST